MQQISKLGPISCVCVGDVMNQDTNVLIVITADGWGYLYYLGDSLPRENLAPVSNKIEIEQVCNSFR